MGVTRRLRCTMAVVGLLTPLCLQAQQSVPVHPAPGAGLPDLATLVAGVRRHLLEEGVGSAYTWIERETEVKLDGDGKATAQSTKVYEVYPAAPGTAQPYRRLISRDGVPVASSELLEGDRRQNAVQREAQRALQREDAEERARRLSRGAEERRKRERLIDEVFQVTSLRVLRREWLGGRPTIAVAFAPRAGSSATTRVGAIAQRLAGTVWVDEEDLEPVKLEARAVDDIDYGFGMFARVFKGTSASWEQQRLADGTWLPSRLAIRASARIMLLRRLRFLRFIEYLDYRPFKSAAVIGGR